MSCKPSESVQAHGLDRVKILIWRYILKSVVSRAFARIFAIQPFFIEKSFMGIEMLLACGIIYIAAQVNIVLKNGYFYFGKSALLLYTVFWNKNLCRSNSEPAFLQVRGLDCALFVFAGNLRGKNIPQS